MWSNLGMHCSTKLVFETEIVNKMKLIVCH